MDGGVCICSRAPVGHTLFMEPHHLHDGDVGERPEFVLAVELFALVDHDVFVVYVGILDGDVGRPGVADEHLRDLIDDRQLRV